MNLLTKGGKLFRIGTKLVKYVADCFCCCPPCPEDCDCVITFTITLPGVASVSDSFPLSQGWKSFSKFEPNGYLAGIVVISCECGVWTLTIDMCYGTGGEGVVAIYEATVDGSEGGCPPTGTLELELVDGDGGPLEVSAGIYCS